MGPWHSLLLLLAAGLASGFSPEPPVEPAAPTAPASPPPHPPTATWPPCPSIVDYAPPPNAPPLKYPHDGGRCHCAKKQCEKITPHFNWIFTLCAKRSKSHCPKTSPGCACSENNQKYPTYLRMNYVATYQLAEEKGKWGWSMVKDSSLNLEMVEGMDAQDNDTRSKKPLVYDVKRGVDDFAKFPNERDVFTKDPPMDERIINSISGGGGGWDRSIFPYNTTSPSAPGVMFVFSGTMANAAWFALNRATLDRGPGAPTCGNSSGPFPNCWNKGSAGEIDFLETPNLFGDYKKDDPEWGNKMWATTYNGAGRCFPVNKMSGTHCPYRGYCGANPVPANITTHRGPQTNFYNNGWLSPAGGPQGMWNYNWVDWEEHLWVAIIDVRGVHIYKDPPFEGLTRTTASTRINQLAPDFSVSGVANGACGDPKVYSEEERKKPCAVFLPSGAGSPTKEQFKKSTQLVPEANRHMYRYMSPSADTVVPTQICHSEQWWNLFMDTAQPYLPPTTFGMVRTKDLLQKTEQELIVPGMAEGFKWDHIPKWTPVVKTTKGKPQSVERGAINSTCVPGTNESFANCPYSDQSAWITIFVRPSPLGLNVDMCSKDGRQGCCGPKCDLATYRKTLLANTCPRPCTSKEFHDVVSYWNGTKINGGCAAGMPACPVDRPAIAACGPLPPLSFQTPPHGRPICSVNILICNFTSQCTAITGPSTFPFSG